MGGAEAERALKLAYVKSEFSTLIEMKFYISFPEKFYSMILDNLDNYFNASCVFFVE